MFIFRAIYICKSGDKHYWQTLLFKNFFESEENNILKVRALKCLIAVSEKETFLNFYKCTSEEFINFTDKLLILSEIEYFGFKFDMEKLDSYCKTELLRRLTHFRNPNAVKIMASISITYDIRNLKSWKYIINSAISMKMVFKKKRDYNLLINFNFD